MFITTSRKAKRTQKIFCKFCSLFFSDVLYVPRGETSIKKFYEKARYLGHSYFLLISKDFKLNIFVFEKEDFYIKDTYEISELKTHLKVPISFFKKMPALEKPFFLNLFEEDKNSDCAISILNNKNNFSFMLDEKEIGFSFTLKKET